MSMQFTAWLVCGMTKRPDHVPFISASVRVCMPYPCLPGVEETEEAMAAAEAQAAAAAASKCAGGDADGEDDPKVLQVRPSLTSSGAVGQGAT